MNIIDLLAKNDMELWAEAENDKDPYIRQESFRHTSNWSKAENDKAWAIRLESFRHTSNWSKAENDENANIRREAKEVLKKIEEFVK